MPTTGRGCLTASLSGLLLGAQAQPIVFSTSPVRNANSAPRPGNVALTYSQNIRAASASNVRVFSAQAGGRKAFTSASVSGGLLTVDPAQDFRPGEVVSVTAPATVLSTGGVAARPYVYQFTAQAGVGPGVFSPGADFGVGSNPNGLVMADVDGDGDPDMLTANDVGSSLSIRLNNGAGTYTSLPDLPLSFRPYSVVAADLDGDGDLDLLIANQTIGSTLSILFRTYALTTDNVLTYNNLCFIDLKLILLKINNISFKVRKSYY